MTDSKCSICAWSAQRISGGQDFCAIVCGKEGDKTPSRLRQYPKPNEWDIIVINRAAKQKGISYGRYVALGYILSSPNNKKLD